MPIYIKIPSWEDFPLKEIRDKAKVILISTWGKLKHQHSIQLCIILTLVFMSTLFCMRNGIDLRAQRIGYLIHVIIFCGGAFLFFFRDKLAGILVLYASVLAFRLSADIQTAIILISMISIYIGLTYYEGKRTLIYDFIIFVAAVNLAFQIGQALNYHWITFPEECKTHWPGLMANRNETSALYAITGAACLRKNRYWFLIITLVGLWLSMSLGGVLAFTVMMIAWAVRNIYKRNILLKKFGLPNDTINANKTLKYYIPHAAIVLVLGFLMFYGTFVHPFDLEKRRLERFIVWEVTTKTAMLKPFGHGFGQYEIVIPLITSWKYLSDKNKGVLFPLVKDRIAYNKAVDNVLKDDPNFYTGEKQKITPFIQAHQDFIEWMFAAGWVGLLFLLAYLASTLWQAFKNVDNVPFYGIIAACGTCMTFFSMQIIPLSVITVMYLAFAKRKS